MSKKIYTSKGIPLNLGRELGKGGEGEVFEVTSLSNQVAKLYHSHALPNQRKQAKLRYMVTTADAQLLNYVAWPQETLHSIQGGPVIGFLMPKVTGKEPVHMVYSPAHRRQDNPNAAWDFLLFVARNIAASFETVHAHGHVIGDVNQNSFMVGRDSKVVLIDSDSFQVNASGTIHLCEVAVAHFTPPELQSLSSFDGFTRTANHDNFGLALLVFHVLFGGRHPFSGVPLRSGVGDALEADIKNFRYAYAGDYQARGLGPPPRSIPVKMLPDMVQSMFHVAFTEKGATGSRPTAHQWVTALDEIRAKLRKCKSSSKHVFPGHLSMCPWCSLEHQGVVYFVDLGTKFTATPNGFVLAQVWALIQAVPPPSPLVLPTPGNYKVAPQPLPPDIPGEGTITFYRFAAIAVAVTLVVAAPNLWIIALILGFVGWSMASSAGSAERSAEKVKRQSVKARAKNDYESIVERAKKEAGLDGYNTRRNELTKIKEELERLPKLEKDEIDKLHSTARARQKQKFLERCYIDNANISSLGPTRKASLRSFGIETAADVSKVSIMQVRGFGESLTRAVLDWKASCERRFVFDPSAAVSASDKDVVRRKFAAKRVMLERVLAAAPAELQQYRQRASALLVKLSPDLENAAKKLAQADADLSVC
jgi:DNA-binding helix-hairpin-helix protein with protein kinase domain